MIIFDKLVYKNLLSSGNQEVEINFKEYHSTLLVGENGAGKSTFIDALCFCMFGKGFRKAKKSQLINTVNNKNMLTTLTFSIGNKSYKIVRGSKPNVFEIWIDDEMLNQDASSRDYQTILEDQILKLNYKSFTQIVVLGSSSYIPFMQLPLGSRREIIESLLDITVFTDMNKILKGKLKTLENELVELKAKFDIVKKEYDLKTEFKDKKSGDLNTELKQVQEKIDFAVTEIDKYQKAKDAIAKDIIDLDFEVLETDHNTKVAELQISQQQFTSAKQNWESAKTESVNIQGGITKAKETLQKFDSDLVLLYNDLSSAEETYNAMKDPADSIKSFEDEAITLGKGIHGCDIVIGQKQAEITFYGENDICNSCNREISESLRTETISKLETDIKTQTDAKKTLQVNLDANVWELSEVKKDKTNRDNLATNIKATQVDIEHVKSNIITVNNAVVVLNESEATNNINIKKYADEIDVVTLKITDLTSVDFESVFQIAKKKHDDFGKISTTVSARFTQAEFERDSGNQRRDAINADIKTNEEYAVQIEALDKDMKSIASDVVDKDLTVEHHKAVGVMLKDDGIKTRIIKHYLPMINKTINEYLEQFNFPVSFFFDESFNETIKSRFRDKFGYNSFSEGEKARIDLALMFTWRTIAMAKNRTATNILVFDEVFDSSMDGEGSDSFMKIIEDVQKTSNVFVISHKEEMTTNQGFAHIMEAFKNGNFSYLREYNG